MGIAGKEKKERKRKEQEEAGGKVRLRAAKPNGAGIHQVIHVGQRKTATTWLGRILQTAAKSTGTFEKVHNEVKQWARGKTKRGAGEPDWDSLVQLLAQWRGRDVFVSAEGLLSFDHDGMSAALAEALPKATILVTTRSPAARMRSVYRQKMAIAQKKDVDSFGDWFLEARKGGQNDLQSIQTSYANAFGREAVQFLPYELLRDDEQNFLNRISEMCGVDLSEHLIEAPNSSPPDFYFGLLQRVNDRLTELDPEWQDTEECKAFLQISARAVAYATDLWPEFQQRTEKLDLYFEKPELPDHAMERFREMHAPLRNLPLYKPYLAEYGLD